MNNEFQKTHVSEVKTKKTGNLENAFTYNILMPDFVIFVLGMSGAFGALLTFFS